MAENAAPDVDQLRAKANDALKALACVDAGGVVETAKALVGQLRGVREYELMGRLAEAVSRQDPKDATNRRLYAQYFIETGKVTAAIDVLRPLTRLAKQHPEYIEAAGLLGRAYKQIFFDAGDKTTSAAREALKQAINAYQGCFKDSGSTWHGVNLLALLYRARTLGIRLTDATQPKIVAEAVIATLQRQPAEQRDEWYCPTLAEASLGLDDWTVVETNLREYIASPGATAFHIASTLRQFTQIWNLEQDERGRALVNILRARLAELPGGEVQLSPADLQRLQRGAAPSQGALEAVLGLDGPKTYAWWKTGLNRALAVASIRAKLGERVGTGFIVRAGDVGRDPADELLVLTNFHVVNQFGANPGIRPEDAEVVFEAADGTPRYNVATVLWSSPLDRHDASLLRVTPTLNGLTPLPIAAALPVLAEKPRVYVVGYPGGRDLAFSFQDNELLDHEGPPAGVPQIPGVLRVHYRAPTEGGSSGSPVFNGRLWEVIALHHKGGKAGMPFLNGRVGTYAANEGVSMGSIIAAMREMPSAAKTV